jgi:DNA-directed RNA polymerase specialized sigma24 family protein
VARSPRQAWMAGTWPGRSRVFRGHREVLTLAYFEGLSQREISRRTGVPLGTIKSRTTAALKRLHQSLLNPGAEEVQRG